MGAVRKHGSCAGCAARTAGKRACAMLPARFVLCCTSVLLVQPVTVLFAAQIAAASPVPIHTTEGGRSPFHEPNAVLLNVTQADLNRILQGTVRSLGGPVFEGHSSHPTKNMFDLRYRVDVSDPVLKLGADGEVDVAFSIREASLDVAAVGGAGP